MDEEIEEILNGFPPQIDNINGGKPSIQLESQRHLFKLNETLKMVLLIKNHPLIWDRSHPEYSSGLSRALAFEQVASKLNIPVDDVRWKWQILRKEYFKKIAVRKRNHAVGIISRPWKWSKALSFLDKMRESAENSIENGCIVKKSPKNDFSLLASAQQTVNVDNDSKDLQSISTNNTNPQENEIIELDDFEDAAKFFCETVYSPAHSNDDDDDDNNNNNNNSSGGGGSGKKPEAEAAVERKIAPKPEPAKRQIIDLENETNGAVFDFKIPNKKPANFHQIRHVITNGSGVLKNIRLHKITAKGSIINSALNHQNTQKEPAPLSSSTSTSSSSITINNNSNKNINNGNSGEQPDKTIKSLMEFLKVQNQILLDKSQKEDLLLTQLMDKNKELFSIHEREQKSLLKQQDPFYAYTIAKLPLLEDLPRTSKWIDKFQTIMDQAFRTMFDEYQQSIEPSTEEKKPADKPLLNRSNRKR